MKPAPDDAAAELLADLVGVFERLKVRWYVFGAQAVIIHGLPRTTADVDVTASLPAERLDEALAALKEAGFVLRIRKRVAAFIAQNQVVPLVHRATELPLDLILAGEGPEQEFLERAVTVRLGRVRIPVVSAEDLIVMKVLAGRPKDLEDVRGVVRRQRRKLDVVATRDRLREIEVLLDRSDLVPVLDGLVAEASR